MIEHVIENAPVARVKIFGADTSFVDLRLHKELHADELTRLRDAYKREVANASVDASESEKADWLDESGHRNSIEDGDSLDITSFFNQIDDDRGFFGYMKVGCRTKGRTLIVGSDGLATTDPDARRKIEIGTLANVGVRINGFYGEDTGTPIMRLQLVWLQHIGPEPADLPNGKQIDGAKLFGTKALPPTE